MGEGLGEWEGDGAGGVWGGWVGEVQVGEVCGEYEVCEGGGGVGEVF